jgi:hypothetical protein
VKMQGAESKELRELVLRFTFLRPSGLDLCVFPLDTRHSALDITRHPKLFCHLRNKNRSAPES